MSKYILNADLSNPVHSNFVGNAAVFHGYAGMSDHEDRVYTEEQAELEADRAAAIGVKIARTMYRRYAEFNEETGKWNFDTHNMNCFTRWCERLYKRGIDVAIQAGWCNPGDITGTGWNDKIPGGDTIDTDIAMERYVEWMVETLKYLIIEKGLTNVKYVLIFTEPQGGLCGILKGYTHPYDTWCAAAEALHNGFVKAGIRDLVKLVGPNEGSTTDSHMLKHVAQRVKDYIDIFSTHNYLSGWASEDSGLKNGDGCVVFQCAGARIQQNIIVEPNTDYEMKIIIKGFTKNDKYISGHMLFGAFNPNEFFEKNHISGGGSPTPRININSTKMLDAALIPEDWEEFSHTFNTGDLEEICVGVFCDIKQPNMGAYIKQVIVTKKGDDKNIVKNSDFSDPDFYYTRVIRGNLFDRYKWGWIAMASPYIASNSYHDWHRWVNTAMKHLPEGKEFWFDEYNVNGAYFDKHYDPYYATKLATATISLMTSGSQSSIMWTLFDQQWPNNHEVNHDCWYDGDHRWGVMPNLMRDTTPYPSFYSTGLLFRYMGGGEGTKVYEIKDGEPIFGAITVSPEGKIGIAVVNTFDGEREFELNLSQSLGSVKLQKRVYDPATIEPNAEAKPLAPVGEITVDNKISDTLAPYSLVVYSNID